MENQKHYFHKWNKKCNIHGLSHNFSFLDTRSIWKWYAKGWLLVRELYWTWKLGISGWKLQDVNYELLSSDIGYRSSSLSDESGMMLKCKSLKGQCGTNRCSCKKNSLRFTTTCENAEVTSYTFSSHVFLHLHIILLILYFFSLGYGSVFDDIFWWNKIYLSWTYTLSEIYLVIFFCTNLDPSS